MIYVTGANGQLGNELKKEARLKDAVFLDRSVFNLEDLSQVEKFLQEKKITCLINAAAYTQVDKAESEKELAIKINAEAPALMAKYASEKKFKLIHFSTDYVFDGRNFKPYVETDATNPVNFYGKTKLMGEEAVLKRCPEALILRTSWVYSSHGKNFLKTILRLAGEKPSLNIVSDQIGTPTWVGDLSKISLDALDQNLSGIFHFSNEGVTSWYDFAKEILRTKNIGTPVLPIVSQEYPTPAARPHFSVLDKRKIKSALNTTIPHWTDSLNRCVREIV
jgi:dTDP-4-dehydrorhamnose reductase